MCSFFGEECIWRLLSCSPHYGSSDRLGCLLWTCLPYSLPPKKICTLVKPGTLVPLGFEYLALVELYTFLWWRLMSHSKSLLTPICLARRWGDLPSNFFIVPSFLLSLKSHVSSAASRNKTKSLWYVGCNFPADVIITRLDWKVNKCLWHWLINSKKTGSQSI